MAIVSFLSSSLIVRRKIVYRRQTSIFFVLKLNHLEYGDSSLMFSTFFSILLGSVFTPFIYFFLWFLERKSHFFHSPNDNYKYCNAACSMKLAKHTHLWLLIQGIWTTVWWHHNAVLFWSPVCDYQILLLSIFFRSWTTRTSSDSCLLWGIRRSSA
jgi:hypothetical protein